MHPEYECYQIKSFKHNGHIHRIWFENWLVPGRLLLPEHAAENMIVLIN
jgi:protein associated with RNAse G/E